MRLLTGWILMTLLIVLLPPRASGLAAGGPDLGKRAPTSERRALPVVLDPEFRHRKRHQLELSLFGGTYLGASIKKSWIAGARTHFHLNNMWAVGVGYGFSRHAVNYLEPRGEPLSQRNTHYLHGEGVLSNDVAMRMGQKVIEMDLFMSLGAGARLLDGKWGPLGVIGGGVKIYSGLPWLAVRIDVTNYLHQIPLAQGSKIDMDVSFAVSLSFLFPPDPSPLERE